MYDLPPALPPALPPDLPRLRDIATYLQIQLAYVQRRIAEAEQREREASRPAAARRGAPPAWTLQIGIGADPRPVAVHHGECGIASSARTRSMSQRDAIEALAAGVAPCSLCRPERELQVD